MSFCIPSMCTYMFHYSQFYTLHSQPTQISFLLQAPQVHHSSSIFIYFINSLMDSQQQSVYNYSQQMESTEQPPISSQQTTATTSVVSTPIYKEPHILDQTTTPSEKLKKAKKAKLGETFVSRPLVPLIESPSKSFPPHSRTVNLKKIASSLCHTTPIYTQSEPLPSTTKPSDTPTPNPPSPSFLKFNLSTITLPVSEAEMLNEPISPISSTPSYSPYYIISYDSGPFDRQSPTLAQLQAHVLASQQQPEPEANTPPPKQLIPPPSEQPQTPPSEQPPNPPPEQPTIPPSDTPIIPPSEKIIIPTSQTPADTTQTPPTYPSPNSEPEPTFPTLEISLFAKSSVEKIRSLSENSDIKKLEKDYRLDWSERQRKRPEEKQKRKLVWKKSGGLEKLYRRLLLKLWLLLKLRQKQKLTLKRQHA
ncbi:extensin-like [Lathyrus oleraceus]|uniref:extensin-like n=1 Tax=Pisum sativum TaxID=3888 RepID=UPI0021D0E85E|nr:extensin-like [Pisum sativum]